MVKLNNRVGISSELGELKRTNWKQKGLLLRSEQMGHSPLGVAEIILR